MPNQPPITLSSCYIKRKQLGDETCFLSTVERPEGRFLATAIQKNSLKVGSQSAPVGPNGEICPIATFDYCWPNRVTHVTDAENHLTGFHYDDTGRITDFEVYDDQRKIYRKDFYQWNSKNGNLQKKIITDGAGKTLLSEEYRYDKNHNVIQEILRRENECWILTNRTFSDDGFNLKLTESDEWGKKICYSYVPGTNLLASAFTVDGNQIKKRVFCTYDDCAICTKVIIDDGKSADPNDLKSVTYRKIVAILPRYQLPCFGLGEVVEEKTIDKEGNEVLLSKIVYTYTPFGKVLKDHYDSQNQYRFSIHNEYDFQERLTATTDAFGQRVVKTYDVNNNLLTLQGPDGFYKQWVYDKVNRPIKEIDSLGVNKTIAYNKLGKIVSVIDEHGFETKNIYDFLGRIIATEAPDGGVTKKQYDEFGNCILEIDPMGIQPSRRITCYS